MDLGLKDKVALVTGGSEGIGLAAARSMAAEGAKAVICARRSDVLEWAAAEIRSATGGEVLAIPTDVREPDQLDELFDRILATYGRIDVLVNNAGTSAASHFESVTDDAWLGRPGPEAVRRDTLLADGDTAHESPGRGG